VHLRKFVEGKPQGIVRSKPQQVNIGVALFTIFVSQFQGLAYSKAAGIPYANLFISPGNRQ
jgi:hypothetical protein